MPELILMQRKWSVSNDPKNTDHHPPNPKRSRLLHHRGCGDLGGISCGEDGMSAKYLSKEHVHELNEKHGWFEFGDAQGDVSVAFAQDAIAKYETIRSAAPDLLEVLKDLIDRQFDDGIPYAIWDKAEAAVKKAEGK